MPIVRYKSGNELEILLSCGILASGLEFAEQVWDAVVNCPNFRAGGLDAGCVRIADKTVLWRRKGALYTRTVVLIFAEEEGIVDL